MGVFVVAVDFILAGGGDVVGLPGDEGAWWTRGGGADGGDGDAPLLGGWGVGRLERAVGPGVGGCGIVDADSMSGVEFGPRWSPGIHGSAALAFE